jgi:Ferredoxin-like domain in Api92-like protein
MPNHVDTDLVIKGPNLDAIENFVKQEEDGTTKKEAFSSDKILPMPPIFNNTTSPDNGSDLNKLAKAQTGYSNWYDWAMAKLGSKWGCYDSVLVSKTSKQLKYNFNSAWSPITPVIQHLSTLFPENTFDMKYYECGSGFKGHVLFQNGEALIDIHESYNGKRGG